VEYFPQERACVEVCPSPPGNAYQNNFSALADNATGIKDGLLVARTLQCKRNFVDERELLLKVGRGDVKAFEKLYKTFQPLLRNFITSRNRWLTDQGLTDVVQETFFRVWVHRKRFRGDSSPKTYLFSVAKHVLRS
jgi:hypothetical protein